MKHGLRSLQTLLNYPGFMQVKRLTSSLALAPLLECQPRFSYKYLSRYSAASFSRRTRLAALLNHYQFLSARVRPEFFGQLPAQPVLWRAQCGADEVSITLSYPQLVGFECELSLNFFFNSTLLQVVGFVIVPGHVVGATTEHALLLSQVQGTRHAALLKQATKTLHDSTPASLLVNAAYGLAEALGITGAAGVSSAEQLGIPGGHHFDYDAFWQQFRGERNSQNLYLLAVPAPERPLLEIKHNHRARTLRKRHYKQQLRESVARQFSQAFLK